MYGSTSLGGLGNDSQDEHTRGGLGTIFRISPDGALSTLVVFNGFNGSGPSALQRSSDGTLYGITSDSGATNTANRYEEYSWRPFKGAGTIFKISATGKFQTLVLFYGPNGLSPDSFIVGKDGNFYGTTASGGTQNLGTIFRLTPNGSFTTLYSFTESSGSWPCRTTLMQAADGNLYGTTTRRGENQCGSIFRLSLSSR